MPDDLKPPTDGIPLPSWVRTPPIVRAELVCLVRELARSNGGWKKWKSNCDGIGRIRDSRPRQTSPPPTSPGRRTRGGPKGQAGHQRPLSPVEQVDEVVAHRPMACAQGGALMLGDDPAPHRYQVAELPVLKANVTERQVPTVTCPCGGAKDRGLLPASVAASPFGPHPTSLMALWMGCYRLSKRQFDWVRSPLLAYRAGLPAPSLLPSAVDY